MVKKDTLKYKFDEILRDGVIDTDKPSALLRHRLTQDLAENYEDVFATLIACEEHQMCIDIRRYDMQAVTLAPREGGRYLGLKVVNGLQTL